MGDETHQTLKNALAALRQPVVAITLLNVSVALIAFIKDIWLAAYAGTTLYADALTLAFFLPDSIGNNILAMAISVACIPIYSHIAASGSYKQLHLSMTRISFRFMWFTVFLMVVAYGLSGVIVRWLTGASDHELARIVWPLLLILLPTIVLFVFIALGTAFLQSLQRFMTPAAAPLLFNLVFLAGVVFGDAAEIPIESGILVVGAGILLGTGLMAYWIGRAWRKSILSMKDKESRSPTEVRDGWIGWKEVLRLFFPYLIVLLSVQAIYLAERYMLSTSDAGAVAALNYAFRLSQFPVWVFVAAVIAIILPSLTKLLALDQPEKVNELMSYGLRMTILIVSPIMVFMYVLHEPLIAALFQRGAFDAHSLELTSTIIEGYSLSILSQSVSLICLRYFLAVRHMTFITIVYVMGGIGTIITDFWLLQWLGPRGIGFGAAVGAAVNAAIMLFFFLHHSRLKVRNLLANWRIYRNLLLTLLLLPLYRVVWLNIDDHSSMTAIVFVLSAGSVYGVIYIFSLRKYLPVIVHSHPQ